MAHDRTSWTRGTAGEIKIGNKTYKNLVEFTRPCVTCREPFSIFVTHKIADGAADSNNFGLKNCEKHRRSSVREIGPELETLGMINNTMKAELEGLYERVKLQSAEIQELKARLAKYELQPAMEAMARDAPFQVRGHDAAPALTFPWEKT